jgi:predicted esterase/LysM repeat protein
LIKIAKRYKVSVDALRNANGLKPKAVLRPGQRLIIPDAAAPRHHAANAQTKGEHRPVSKDSGSAGVASPKESPAATTAVAAPEGASKESPAAAKAAVAGSDGSDPEPVTTAKASNSDEGRQNGETGTGSGKQEIRSDEAGSGEARAAKSNDRPSGTNDDEPMPRAPDMQVLKLPSGGSAYYYEPIGPGRLSMRPVLMYMHGRGGQPASDCARWASVARPLGWLICPRGPGARGEGRGWNNSWIIAQRTAMSAIEALRDKYGKRVQLYGNTLMGFSEGAFVAMNVGVREPHTFNRWFVLAANSSYWGGPGIDQLEMARERVRRVYLITGEHDEVVEGTRQVRSWLRKYGVTTRITTPKDLGHELALESQPELYRMALIWLQSGEGASGGKGHTDKSHADKSHSTKHAKKADQHPRLVQSRARQLPTSRPRRTNRPRRSWHYSEPLRSLTR